MNPVFPWSSRTHIIINCFTLCHQLYEVATPEFKEYIKNVKKNAQTLANKLIELGYSISSNGTDNHIVLVNVRDKGVTGSKVEKVCVYLILVLIKMLYMDTSAMNPGGGIRLGSSAMTTRLRDETHFTKNR